MPSPSSPQSPIVAGVGRPLTPVPPAYLAWLDGELADWQHDGLVDATAADAIRSRYVGVRRFTLVRVVLGLGAAFVAIGLIWLVAANLDRFAPLVRFVIVAAIWLGLTALAEVLAVRAERAGDHRSPVVGAARLLAGAGFTAVVFQAAQSLQVPAYEPALLGYAALGTLLYSYAVRGLAPLVLGVVGTGVWFVWQATDAAQTVSAFAVAALAGAAVAAAVAVLHRSRWWPEAAAPWRETGAALAFIGMFAAAVPRRDPGSLLSAALLVGVVLAVCLAAAAGAVGEGPDRAEVAMVLLALAVAAGLSLWGTTDLDTAHVGPTGYLRAAVAVAAYLLLATGYAAVGAMRDSPRLTVLATVAVVVFVTFQAFAVFAPILSGAALFLAVGAILIGSGYLADRGRRRLVARVEEERS